MHFPGNSDLCAGVVDGACPLRGARTQADSAGNGPQDNLGAKDISVKDAFKDNPLPGFTYGNIFYFEHDLWLLGLRYDRHSSDTHQRA